MSRRMLFGILGALILLVVGSVLGLAVGITVGGNFFSDVEFAGQRGYEATGLLGAWVGAAAGAVLGALLGSRIGSRRPGLRSR